MASDEPTSDESEESRSDKDDESLDFGSSADEPEPEPNKDETKAGEEVPEEAVDSESDLDSESKENEKYDPNKIPPLSQRATLFGAWGCVALFVVVLLVFFVLIKSAIDKIDDYGAVANEDSDEEPREELPPEEPEEPEEPVTPQVTRVVEWPSAYPEARAAARIDLRPVVIVFTAEYATESIDVFDGVFTSDDVENYLERFYQVVHIDMGAQGEPPDPSIALCEVEFLPHVCYLHPETEEKLNADTTGMIGTGALLRELGVARSAYEATAEAD